jgi:hypothetical protein
VSEAINHLYWAAVGVRIEEQRTPAKKEVARSNRNDSFGAPETKTISVISDRISAPISGAACSKTANALFAIRRPLSNPEAESALKLI